MLNTNQIFAVYVDGKRYENPEYCSPEPFVALVKEDKAYVEEKCKAVGV